jgi:tRNA threonylcarbamoyladenosine biosynthesis protein TsaE
MSLFASKHPSETRRLAAEFALSTREGDVIVLTGDLGAGKTEFVKGLAHGLGSSQPVSSPTFTLVQEYRGGRLPLFHMDFYRLESEAELIEIGLDDYLSAGGVCVIEWGEKFSSSLPPDFTTVSIRLGEGDERILQWAPR